MPRPKRNVVSGWGKLTRGIVDTLREAQASMTARDVVGAIFPTAGTDCKLMTDHTRRVSKALRVLAQAGRVVRATDDLGRVVWRKA